MTKLKNIFFLIILSLALNLKAQQDTINPKRLKTVVGTEALIYTASMTGLYSLWYKDIPSSSFRFFDDNNEWLQMDKMGHAMTSYYIGVGGYHSLKWAGVSDKKSIWYGGTLGWAYLTSVEVFDGFSSDWGFSWGDITANTLGSGMFIAQQLVWKEQRVVMKYSYYQSDYWELNPDLLGETLLQNSLKDYNGQTLWLSANVASFLGKETKFPKWLNFAVGYGADGMVGAVSNPNHPEIKRYRQYYMALDIDLTRIKTKSKFANTVLGAFGFIKFPLPTVEFNNGGNTNFYWLYF